MTICSFFEFTTVLFIRHQVVGHDPWGDFIVFMTEKCIILISYLTENFIVYVTKLDAVICYSKKNNYLHVDNSRRIIHLALFNKNCKCYM